MKVLKLSVGDAAQRELKVADELAGRPIANVVPILDAGKDGASYYVVMARAEKSLQQAIRDGGRFDDGEAAKVLLQIVTGLCSVPELVHRDLKPGNILLHEGEWKIADFGIARFVEDATSTHTLKECLSPQYAAPEQWNAEHATKATDVYALGCVGYALLTGNPPFAGPTTPDYCRQHLHDPPPKIVDRDPRLIALIAMMLRKPPQSRPTLSRTREVLGGILSGGAGQGGLARLARVAANIAHADGEREAASFSERLNQASRSHLFAGAMEILSELGERLIDRIHTAAPAAECSSPLVRLRLGLGELRLTPEKNAVPANAFPQSKWDVLAGATVEVRQRSPEYVWSASLWYARTSENEDYRWHEVSYFANPFSPTARSRKKFEPFSLTDDLPNADLAASPVIAMFQKAFGPRPVDDENADEFIDRWGGLLASAAKGELSAPRSLPLP